MLGDISILMGIIFLVEDGDSDLYWGDSDLEWEEL